MSKKVERESRIGKLGFADWRFTFRGGLGAVVIGTQKDVKFFSTYLEVGTGQVRKGCGGGEGEK